MSRIKFLVKLNKNGKEEIMENGLDLLLSEGKGFICEDVDCDSFFTCLKILHPENPQKVFEVWIPSSYIQFVLKIPTGSDKQKAFGFDIEVFDSGIGK